MASAGLLPGEETSGKLVMQVKRNMEPLAQSVDAKQALVDGSPGIGCPVIASVSGVDVVILVTEPTLSGMHDLERILGVVNHFRIPSYLVINKADLSADLTKQLEQFASDKTLPVLGCIPYDGAVTDRLIEGRSVAEDEPSPAGAAMRDIFKNFMEVASDL